MSINILAQSHPSIPDHHNPKNLSGTARNPDNGSCFTAKILGLAAFDNLRYGTGGYPCYRVLGLRGLAVIHSIAYWYHTILLLACVLVHVGVPVPYLVGNTEAQEQTLATLR